MLAKKGRGDVAEGYHKKSPWSAENRKFPDEKLRKQLPPRSKGEKKLQNIELEKPPGDERRERRRDIIKKRRYPCELKASAR